MHRSDSEMPTQFNKYTIILSYSKTSIRIEKNHDFKEPKFHCSSYTLTEGHVNVEVLL